MFRADNAGRGAIVPLLVELLGHPHISSAAVSDVRGRNALAIALAAWSSDPDHHPHLAALLRSAGTAQRRDLRRATQNRA
jgi:hypothetical protein